ncbi:MAG: hypothetical protein EZS28_001644 [Streblomastix strix]|uniref:Uncharacterized protein n=1 Tax=Streblomastix strix TaxID=222440 RepID=A0A5J4X8H6_9EUKA|nr:MAG: hypothetical protein EZS28_001638 [Streblomastix strix]KAA6402835.1 MAG: hypothetical protein EZS28_001644 [Streblomastix strix]
MVYCTNNCQKKIVHVADDVVGSSQDSLVLHSSGIVNINEYLHWASPGGTTADANTMGTVGDDFIPKLTVGAIGSGKTTLLRSKAEIQRFSSGLAWAIIYLVSDSRYIKKYSAESGIVWMYDQNWYNFGNIVPDQVTPASDATPLADSGTGVAGSSTEYSRRDHKHLLQVSDGLPCKDTSVGNIGTTSSYARPDHQHPTQTADTIPVIDSADGSYGAVDSYARNDHSHPINVQTNASIVPVVNGVGNNVTSAYYSRHDHIHPQQLTYDGNITATNSLNQEEQITKYYQQMEKLKIFKINTRTRFGKIQFNQHQTKDTEIDKYQYQFIPSLSSEYLDQGLRIGADGYPLTFNDNRFVDVATNQTIKGINTIGKLIQVIPTVGRTFNEGTRISRHPTNKWSKTQFHSDPNSNSGCFDNQWLIGASRTNDFNPLGFAIVKAGQEGQTDRGLMISADGNTLTFNGRVL